MNDKNETFGVARRLSEIAFIGRAIDLIGDGFARMGGERERGGRGKEAENAHG
nr:hypothetical protein [Henriciella sp.]